MSTTSIEDMARRVLDALPAGFGDAGDDLRRNLKAGLVQVLRDMELVTREDFEVQRLVLARTREKLEQMEARVAALEARAPAASAAPGPDPQPEPPSRG